ncbi:hypothetical protein E2562_019678 [Oryza meyeriana var. granulata]|uniref:Uncharacterized protein n=1 Tax=Oryza meyeriana var. granulata TaxID=110450 RepID=A0A6G1C7I6_9ORYZ|nr:hypothetical protein E2562_019678 [Oryza meyeriana var. granulata]
MNHLAALSALKAMARLAPVGITQLNLFSAISVLFLAQAPMSMWLKVLVVPLPVVFLPLGLGAIMLSKLADSDDRALNLGAAFVLTEFVYVLTVMTEAPVAAVATVTALLIAATVLVWRSTFNYPKLSTSGIAEGNNVMAEELVIKHPKLAKIIKLDMLLPCVMYLAYLTNNNLYLPCVMYLAYFTNNNLYPLVVGL